MFYTIGLLTIQINTISIQPVSPLNKLFFTIHIIFESQNNSVWHLLYRDSQYLKEFSKN